MNVIRKLLKHRGMFDELDHGKIKIPKAFKDIIKSGDKKVINIVGDYDCDGFASIVVAKTLLSELGFDVEYYIPDRASEGYGLSMSVIARMRDCDIVLTVDNGTVADDALKQLSEWGIQSIVTDHHLAESCIADIVINPNCMSVADPSFQNLCAAQVIFSAILICIDVDKNNEYDYAISQCMPWVIIATIADMVKIDTINYQFVEFCINLLRTNSDNQSFNALLDTLNIDHKHLTVDDIGYLIGPTINAVGRMDDMTLAVQAALDDDYNSAKKKWDLLKKHNADRKKKTAEGEALSDEDQNILVNDNIIIVQADIHHGVAGIVASRLKEKHQKPAIVFDMEGKASCRSVPGFHIRDALIKEDKFLLKYGGHAMAAGLTLKSNKSIKAFAIDMNSHAYGIPNPELRPVFCMPPSKLKKIADDYIYSVWGMGNERPLLESEFVVATVKDIKEKHTSLILDYEGSTFDAMLFNKILSADAIGQSYIIKYELTLNKFNNNRSHTLVINSLEKTNG